MDNTAKKTLVRNTRVVLPKTVFVSEKLATGASATTIKGTRNSSHNKLTVASDRTSKEIDMNPKFQSPDLNTILKLSQKIDIVQKTKQIDRKNTKLSSTTTTVVDEKITNKMNFPYDQPIYKDLIPLETKAIIRHCQMGLQPQSSSREPHPHRKDREPNLSDFLRIKETPDYIYQSTINTIEPPSVSNNGQMRVASNNLRLFKIMQNE